MLSKCVVTKAGDSSRGTTVWSCREQREFVLSSSDHDVGKWLIVDGGSVRQSEPLCPTSVVAINGVPGRHVIVTVTAVKPPCFEATFGISVPALHVLSPLLGPIDVLVDIGKYPENVPFELDVLKKSPQLKHALLKMSDAEWIARSQDVKLLSREVILNSMEQLYAEGIVVKTAGNHHIVASEQPDGSTRFFVAKDDRLRLGDALNFVGMDFCESAGLAVAPEPEWRCLIPTDVANEFRISMGMVSETSKSKIRVQRLGWVTDADEVVPRDGHLAASVSLRLEIGLKPLAMNVRVVGIQLGEISKTKSLESEEYTLTAKLTERKGDMTFFYCPAMTTPRNVFSARTDRLPKQVHTTRGLWYKMTLRFYENRQLQNGHPAIVLNAIRIEKPGKPFATSKYALDESTVPSYKTSPSEVLRTNKINSVGVICHKGVDGCYVYSHRLSREALVTNPPLDVNIGDWFHVWFATRDDGVSIAETKGRADVVFQSTPLHRSVLVNCRVNIRRLTNHGPIVCNSNFAPSVYDTRGLSKQVPLGHYTAFVKYVYKEGAAAGHWQLEYLQHRLASA